jgi:hypothetical protein
LRNSELLHKRNFDAIVQGNFLARKSTKMIRGWHFLVLAGFLAQVLGIRSLASSCGICPQGNESGAAGDFPESLLAAQTYPIGNAALTYASFSVVGTTGQDDEREFLVSLGLVSDRGNQVTSAECFNTINMKL